MCLCKPLPCLFLLKISFSPSLSLSLSLSLSPPSHVSPPLTAHTPLHDAASNFFSHEEAILRPTHVSFEIAPLPPLCMCMYVCTSVCVKERGVCVSVCLSVCWCTHTHKDILSPNLKGGEIECTRRSSSLDCVVPLCIVGNHTPNRASL